MFNFYIDIILLFYILYFI